MALEIFVLMYMFFTVTIIFPFDITDCTVSSLHLKIFQDLSRFIFSLMQTQNYKVLKQFIHYVQYFAKKVNKYM